MRPALALAAAGLLATPAAQAAYAPKLDVKIAPATPGQPVAITSTITQQAGETANRTVRVSFPAGFSTNRSTAAICTPDQEKARACPEGSKVGDASAVASVLVLPIPLSGPVYYGGPQPDNSIKVIVLLDNALLAQHLTIEGFVSLRPSDRGFDTVFDGLPNQLTTSFTLAFSGGSVALTKTPTTCGTFPFAAHFTSQRGEQSDATSDVTIAGCPQVPPRIGAPSLDPPRPRAGRSTLMGVTLSEDATLLVEVVRVKTHKVVAKLTAAGKLGGNKLRIRLPKRLRKGAYRVTVRATDADGMAATRSARMTVRRRAR